jgi:hypothetical protein
VWCSRDIRLWSYGGDSRESVYNVRGQHTFDLVTTTRRQSAVIYLSGTWWTTTYAPLPAPGPRGPVCAQASGLRCQGWPTYIRLQLAYGGYAIVVRWLPPTAANLALTKLTVPAGFRQVTPPPAQG